MESVAFFMRGETGGEKMESTMLYVNLIHPGIWETQDLGPSGSSTPMKNVSRSQTHLAVLLPLEDVGQVCCAQSCWVVVWCLSIRYSGELSILYLALLKVQILEGSQQFGWFLSPDAVKPERYQSIQLPRILGDLCSDLSFSLFYFWSKASQA